MIGQQRIGSDILRRVLIIGASGFLGKELYKIFKTDKDYEAFGTYSRNGIRDLEYLDLTDLESIKYTFSKTKPNIVIITSALTNVDYCEVNRKETENINVNGIKNIAKVCKEHNCRVIYISTDYVFDGKSGPYDETDKTSPINYYGKTKLLGEKIIGKEIEDYLLVRTTVVYGWDLESKNFIMQLIRNLSENKYMKVPIDQVSSPTYCPNLAEMIKESCDKNISGTLNIVGSDILDRYSFSIKAAEVLNLKKDLLIPVETKTLEQVAKRPLDAGLKVERISKLLNTKPIGINEGLNEVQKFYLEYKSKQC